MRSFNSIIEFNFHKPPPGKKSCSTSPIHSYCSHLLMCTIPRLFWYKFLGTFLNCCSILTDGDMFQILANCLVQCSNLGDSTSKRPFVASIPSSLAMSQNLKIISANDCQLLRLHYSSFRFLSFYHLLLM